MDNISVDRWERERWTESAVVSIVFVVTTHSTGSVLIDAESYTRSTM